MAGGKRAKQAGDGHQEFVQSLEPEERLLIYLRDELYGGKWEDLRRDLRDRLEGRPYVFKLSDRIEKDLARIEKLEGYEKRYRVNLSEYMGKEREI